LSKLFIFRSWSLEKSFSVYVCGFILHTETVMSEIKIKN
jgi:hypothetical protein